MWDLCSEGLWLFSSVEIFCLAFHEEVKGEMFPLKVEPFPLKVELFPPSLHPGSRLDSPAHEATPIVHPGVRICKVFRSPSPIAPS